MGLAFESLRLLRESKGKLRNAPSVQVASWTIRRETNFPPSGQLQLVQALPWVNETSERSDPTSISAKEAVIKTWREKKKS